MSVHFDVNDCLAVVRVPVGPASVVLLLLEPAERVSQPGISGVPERSEHLEALEYVGHVAGGKPRLEPGP